MATKPTRMPLFARDDVTNGNPAFPAIPQGPNVVEIIAASDLAIVGLIPAEKLAREHFNWLFRNYHDWIEYFDEAIDGLPTITSAATQNEVDAGVVTNKYVNPVTLNGWDKLGKIKVKSADPTPDFLFDKLVEDVGIQITQGVGPNDNKVVINVRRATTNDAIAGTTDDFVMTPLKVQAKEATNAEAAAGVLTTKFLTPANVSSIIGSLYAVGDVIFTAVATNPASRFGGTWAQRSQGRFLAGVGTDTVDSVVRMYSQGNDSVGRYSVALTEAQLPAHSHRLLGTTETDGTIDPLAGSAIAGNGLTGVYTNSGAAAQQHVENTGSNEKHENSPPAFAMYVWEKTA